MKLIEAVKKKVKFLLFQFPRNIKYSFLSNANNVKGKAKIVQPFQLNGLGKIEFGSNVTIGFESSPFLYSGYGYIEARNLNSLISIEERVFINNNVVIISEGEGITISKNTLIGINCEIYDSDFHNLAADKRLTGEPGTSKVLIENNVFIGSNVKILKGVTIGENSIIGSGSVVTKSIPKNVIAAGVPAQEIRKL